jgi:hypothetical protein
LVLTSVVADQGVLNCEHHTFICSECHVTERRAVFIRNGREYDSRPAPAELPPPVLPSLSAEQDRVRIPNFLACLVLKLWGATVERRYPVLAARDRFSIDDAGL